MSIQIVTSIDRIPMGPHNGETGPYLYTSGFPGYIFENM